MDILIVVVMPIVVLGCGTLILCHFLERGNDGK